MIQSQEILYDSRYGNLTPEVAEKIRKSREEVKKLKGRALKCPVCGFRIEEIYGITISKKLEDNYMFTMGDVARCSQYNEAKLYKLFGVNAELLIDRAWGREPTTIADVKAYRPSSNSLSMGQVLHKPYTLPKSITHSISTPG